MITKWNPFREMELLQRQMDRLFDEFAGQPTGLADTRFPRMDVSETDDEIKVRTLMPGLKREDIKISLHQNVLTISGQMKATDLPEGARPIRMERPNGSFQRTVRLNARLDEDRIQARLHDGVLTLTLPKAAAAKPRKIALSNA